MIKPVLAVFLLAVAPLAQAEIYKCTDASGHVTYSNVASKGCMKMNLEPISTIPATKPAAKTPTPSAFPRVDDSAQKARDNDRRKILEQELVAEQKNLDEAKKKLAEGEIALPQERIQGGAINQAKVQERTQPLRDQVELHQRNIEAIQKEMQNLR